MTTDFLFARQSFIRGIGSLGNLNGEVIFNASATEKEADARAISSDWQMVGSDINAALDNYGSEQ